MSERCFICAEDNPNVLQTHHILPRRHGGGDSAENLVTLCANCHVAVERIYDDDFYQRIDASKGDASKADVSKEDCTDSIEFNTAKKHIGEFFDKCDDVIFSGMVMKQALYDKYCEWADANDAPRPARNIFGEVVVNHDDRLIEAEQRMFDGNRIRVYTGVHIEA